MNFVEFLEKLKSKRPENPDLYGEWLGYKILETDSHDGEITTSLKIRKEHLSPSTAVHGGVVSGFLDFSCGCAAFETLELDELCSTVDLSVKYFKPIKVDEEIVAKAKVLHRGRSLCSVAGYLYKSTDMKKPVAMATGTFNIYKTKN